MNRDHHERIRALLDGELDDDAAQALRLEARVDRALGAELRRQENLHQALTSLATPALPASLTADVLLGGALSGADHERIRAYVDGELKADALAALLADARRIPALGRELERQLALHRSLTTLPDPALPARVAPQPARPRWLDLFLGWRKLSLSVPAAATAGALLFGAGAWVGHDRAPASAPAVATATEMIPVRFVFMGGDAQKVSVAGSFNRWSPTATPLRPAGEGIWEATVPLPRGEHRYIFQVDGRWQSDPLAPQLVPDGMGNMDAVIQL